MSNAVENNRKSQEYAKHAASLLVFLYCFMFAATSSAGVMRQAREYGVKRDFTICSKDDNKEGCINPEQIIDIDKDTATSSHVYSVLIKMPTDEKIKPGQPTQEITFKADNYWNVSVAATTQIRFEFLKQTDTKYSELSGLVLERGSVTIERIPGGQDSEQKELEVTLNLGPDYKPDIRRLTFTKGKVFLGVMPQIGIGAPHYCFEVERQSFLAFDTQDKAAPEKEEQEAGPNGAQLSAASYYENVGLDPDTLRPCKDLYDEYVEIRNVFGGDVKIANSMVLPMRDFIEASIRVKTVCGKTINDMEDNNVTCYRDEVKDARYIEVKMNVVENDDQISRMVIECGDDLEGECENSRVNTYVCLLPKPFADEECTLDIDATSLYLDNPDEEENQIFRHQGANVTVMYSESRAAEDALAAFTELMESFKGLNPSAFGSLVSSEFLSDLEGAYYQGDLTQSMYHRLLCSECDNQIEYRISSIQMFGKNNDSARIEFIWNKSNPISTTFPEMLPATFILKNEGEWKLIAIERGGEFLRSTESAKSVVVLSDEFTNNSATFDPNENPTMQLRFKVLDDFEFNVADGTPLELTFPTYSPVDGSNIRTQTAQVYDGIVDFTFNPYFQNSGGVEQDITIEYESRVLETLHITIYPQMPPDLPGLGTSN